ncbi:MULTISPECIES: helix-turn-helix transcriptional regulator [Shewanella]|uniref:Response regulator transcription factor n=1 Tax=Shewanella fidelis TaxID=173509 RepID=A0AAW8NTE7_9GAMM|nr:MULTISPECIES: response regulator transcription factor [Shewanella]MDR8525169.1 response regulator transcription factor [Shewanella fidelis]MDW4811240.1 response regulator transcription factor [Shewanella fidelis]MDW4814981.1 response regulator transcription factor [Shewanella fidelis]MDW4819071.1 response regulator transcription factor [Shewanella fidelis]MDW4823252.1 response regulator transcription factor [Shewanella fidelis]
MSKIDEIVFLHQVASPCHLAILADSIGLKTRVVTDIEQLETDSNKRCFYLVSQQGAALDNNGIPLVATQLVKHVPVALYQVERDGLNGEAALLAGFCGLLFLDERMDLLLTGLRKMLADELWFDRPLLSKVFRHLVSKVEVAPELTTENSETLEVLTNREKTIIQLVSSGARNKEIANKLSISEHTVKAHISSIFRKTQARNRVELLRWAQSFQSHLDLFALTH